MPKRRQNIPVACCAKRYVPGRWVTKTPGDIGYTWGMSWKETCVMSERMKMISSYMGGDSAISELAAEHGVSRKTVYKWIERYEEGGWSALEDQSRAPRHHPNAVTAAVEQARMGVT